MRHIERHQRERIVEHGDRVKRGDGRRPPLRATRPGVENLEHDGPRGVSRRRITLEGFYRLQEEAGELYEFDAGRVLPPVASTQDHTDVVQETYLHLARQLGRKHPCEVHSALMAVRSDAVDRVMRPDVSIVCGPREMVSGTTLAIVRNPRVVIEVLSDSTRADDYGPKLRAYQAIPSVQEIVLMEQEAPLLTVYRRKPSGRWPDRPEVREGTNERTPLVSVSCVLRHRARQCATIAGSAKR